MVCLFWLIFTTETYKTAIIATVICAPAFTVVIIMKIRFYYSIYRSF